MNGDLSKLVFERREYGKKISVRSIPSKFEAGGYVTTRLLGDIYLVKDSSTNKKLFFVLLDDVIDSVFFDEEQCLMRTILELSMMRHFGHHPNLCGLEYTNLPEKEERMKKRRVCFFSENGGTPLVSMMKEKGSEFSKERNVKIIIYQILKALKFLHDGGTNHGCLDPRKVFVDDDMNVRLIEYGVFYPLFTALSADPPFSDRINYVSVENLMLVKEYDRDSCLDIWSTGCIFGELIRLRSFEFKKRRLLKGKHYIDQLVTSLNAVGISSDYAKIMKGNRKAVNYVNQLIRSHSIPQEPELSSLVPKATPEELDLLKKMLCVDIRERIKIDEILQHPYFKTVDTLFITPQFTTPPFKPPDFSKIEKEDSLKMSYEEIDIVGELNITMLREMLLDDLCKPVIVVTDLYEDERIEFLKNKYFLQETKDMLKIFMPLENVIILKKFLF